MADVVRKRDQKIHVWVEKQLLLKFDLLNHRLGRSRDGGIEHAVAEYVENHKGDKNAIDRI